MVILTLLNLQQLIPIGALGHVSWVQGYLVKVMLLCLVVVIHGLTVVAAGRLRNVRPVRSLVVLALNMSWVHRGVYVTGRDITVLAPKISVLIECLHGALILRDTFDTRLLVVDIGRSPSHLLLPKQLHPHLLQLIDVVRQV